MNRKIVIMVMLLLVPALHASASPVMKRYGDFLIVEPETPVTPEYVAFSLAWAKSGGITVVKIGDWRKLDSFLIWAGLSGRNATEGKEIVGWTHMGCGYYKEYGDGVLIAAPECDDMGLLSILDSIPEVKGVNKEKLDREYVTALEFINPEEYSLPLEIPFHGLEKAIVTTFRHLYEYRLLLFFVTGLPLIFVFLTTWREKLTFHSYLIPLLSIPLSLVPLITRDPFITFPSFLIVMSISGLGFAHLITGDVDLFSTFSLSFALTMVITIPILTALYHLLGVSLIYPVVVFPAISVVSSVILKKRDAAFRYSAKFLTIAVIEAILLLIVVWSSDENLLFFEWDTVYRSYAAPIVTSTTGRLLFVRKYPFDYVFYITILLFAKGGLSLFLHSWKFGTVFSILLGMSSISLLSESLMLRNRIRYVAALSRPFITTYFFPSVLRFMSASLGISLSIAIFSGAIAVSRRNKKVPLPLLLIWLVFAIFWHQIVILLAALFIMAFLPRKVRIPLYVVETGFFAVSFLNPDLLIDIMESVKMGIASEIISLLLSQGSIAGQTTILHVLPPAILMSGLFTYLVLDERGMEKLRSLIYFLMPIVFIGPPIFVNRITEPMGALLLPGFGTLINIQRGKRRMLALVLLLLIFTGIAYPFFSTNYGMTRGELLLMEELPHKPVLSDIGTQRLFFLAGFPTSTHVLYVMFVAPAYLNIMSNLSVFLNTSNYKWIEPGDLRYEVINPDEVLLVVTPRTMRWYYTGVADEASTASWNWLNNAWLIENTAGMRLLTMERDRDYIFAFVIRMKVKQGKG